MPDDRKARYRDISDGLLRQRRNLLLISLLMPLFFLSGASTDRINIFGTIVTLDNPQVVKYLLVILFGYFLIRYWQYYQEETYIQDMRREMHVYIFKKEKDYLIKKAREKASFLNCSFLRVCFADPIYDWGGRFAVIPEKKAQVIFPFMRECEFYIYPASEREGHKREELDLFRG